jgi:hypothetical protein
MVQSCLPPNSPPSDVEADNSSSKKGKDDSSVEVEEEEEEGKNNKKKKSSLSQQSSWDAKDAEGNDYLYRLGKEADNLNITVGAKMGMIDPLFAGNFLGQEGEQELFTLTLGQIFWRTNGCNASNMILYCCI